MNKYTFGQLIDTLSQLYPTDLAEDWDPVGIHFGNKNHPVQRILTTLDVTEVVVDEAISLGADTIIAHHPLIFSKIARLDDQQPNIEIYRKLLANHINVYAMHTNVDKQMNGMNDWLAKRLELQHVTNLETVSFENPVGLGRVGELSEPMRFDSLAQHIMSRLNTDYIQVINPDNNKLYNKIAIVGGSAFESVYDAIRAGADLFITGDITYHKVLEGAQLNITIVDAGHFIEHIFINEMAQILNEIVPDSVTIEGSQTNCDPRQLLIRKV